ncbi:MAG: methyltransferase [Treponema sp.]|nr:methyltransferase [Treponema sp.]
MAEYISTFITGFGEVVSQDLQRHFPKIKILNLFDGLIHYKFDGDSRQLSKIIYFNNTFFVLKTMKGKGLNFNSLVGAVTAETKYFLINKGSFRVRFVKENQFQKVDKNISKKAEDCVLRNSKLQLDRLSPTTEIWYSIRRENFAFCGQLISKREFTEKNLNKGELRPEFAYLMCAFAGLKNDEVIADPFAGYGSIPNQIMGFCRPQSLYVSDIEEKQVEIIENLPALKKDFVRVFCGDAFELSENGVSELDVVITDPPWGFYEEIGDMTDFYKKMFASFRRVLKSDGRMIILTARADSLEEAATASGVKVLSSLHTLVNGKKASLFRMSW